jgi:23S rRNA (guanosine2251-2'-O)-methyltransferase
MNEYIEGKRPVIEALRTEIPLREVLFADNVQHDGLIQDIDRKARAAHIPVKTVPRHTLDEQSARGSHQGVMALTRSFPYSGFNDILAIAHRQAADNGGHALIVVLDHITDEGNLGAIARSAEVVGAAGIILPNKRSAQVTAATYKSSAGAITHLAVARVANIGKALDRLKEEGFWVAGASERADQEIWDTDLRGPICLVMGSEGDGLARLTQTKCDFLIALPQVGQTASLNVAQSATACMYEYLRQNRPTTKE